MKELEPEIINEGDKWCARLGKKQLVRMWYSDKARWAYEREIGIDHIGYFETKEEVIKMIKKLKKK